jgi:hypothetical protein
LLLWAAPALLVAAEGAGYRLVQAVGGASLIGKVNDLAASGYRIAVWDATESPVAVLERLPGEAGPHYRYAYVERNYVGFVKIADVNRLAAGGFRILPWTGSPKLVLLENEARRTAALEYRIEGYLGLAGRRLRRLGNLGFRAAGVLFPGPQRGGVPFPVVVVERDSSSDPRGVGDLRSITGKKAVTRLNEAANQGYRVQAGGAAVGGKPQFWLGKDPEGAHGIQYRLEDAADAMGFEALLNRAAAEGFRPVRGCLFIQTGARPTRIEALLENDGGGRGRRDPYRVLTASDLPGLLESINQAAAEGFRPRNLLAGGTEYIVVAEK